MNAITTNTLHSKPNLGVPPKPSEAHQRAGADWVQIEQKDLDRHFLSGEFFISRAALATLTGEGSTLFDVLDWFNASPDSITVGDTRQINSQLQAFFGFDGSKPNRRAFFVEIDLIPKQPEAAEAAPASLTEIFGEPIHVYTRAQALADGELVDVTTTAAEAGFRIPVALTRAVWADCVEWTDADTKRQTARVAKAESSFFFMVYRVPRGGRAMKAKLTRLKACIGPGDDGEPVITIMQPNED